jgi:hypothetical protein
MTPHSNTTTGGRPAIGCSARTSIGDAKVASSELLHGLHRSEFARARFLESVQRVLDLRARFR